MSGARKSETPPIGEEGRRRTAKRRDPRLDFFRGLAMLIIFIAHVPRNAWSNWIPARFGFSDAAEMFVFCSGFAAAIAFGGAFLRGGFAAGTMRILYRCAQIYFAHIALFFAVAGLAAWASEAFDLRDYVGRLNLHGFFNVGEAKLVDLLTLSYVPNYFDILPMYIVVLLLVPVVMLLARFHVALAAGFLIALYVATLLFGLNFQADRAYEKLGFVHALTFEVEAGRQWFFNPLGWQLLFFTGFFLSMGWARAPMGDGRIFWACVVFVLLSVPLANWRIFNLDPTLLEMRRAIHPAVLKTPFAPLRYLHFLALAYICVHLLRHREQWLNARVFAPIVKTGQQALPAFLCSMFLAQAAGVALDALGRDGASLALVNLTGLGCVVAVAYASAFIKAKPWTVKRPPPAAPAPQAAE